ncbi:MerR family transcriptional regulator [Amycolatopsis anabasis]|uniref:MerR family transcriptional regulator n=1 Tax=Amycolatopsis anabasis TaxID=1840409 RepID=UPI00131A7DA5|nr:MerR family transcriptional regulator [Amycolatopsis anabasis]
MSDPDGNEEIRLDIGELAELARVQPSALRYYEREGLLTPVGRSGGRRVFDEQGLLQLAAIDFWQEAGFSIKEMAQLINNSSASMDETKKVASARVAELDQLIEQATHVKTFLSHILRCVHDRVSDCPDYREHLRERADEILSGRYRRDYHLRLQPFRRASGG